MNNDPTKLHGELSSCAINFSMLIGETKELKLNIQEQIELVKLKTGVWKAKSKLLSFKIDFTWPLLRMEEIFID